MYQWKWCKPGQHIIIDGGHAIRSRLGREIATRHNERLRRSYVLAELRIARGARAALSWRRSTKPAKMLQGNMITADEAIQLLLWKRTRSNSCQYEAEQLPIDQLISPNEAAAAALSACS